MDVSKLDWVVNWCLARSCHYQSPSQTPHTLPRLFFLTKALKKATVFTPNPKHYIQLSIPAYLKIATSNRKNNISNTIYINGT